MNRMFYFCKDLQSIYIPSFNIDNVEDMGEMFYSCSNLEFIDLSSFNTKNVKSMN